MRQKERVIEKGLVSVIVPVYNVEQYLERCFESILHQTYPRIELIIVDDGSTDGSGKICDYYRQIDTRISVFHAKHEGTSKARNIGLQFAAGEFIGFVDADDYIADDMYESLIDNMHNGIDIVCCGRRCVVPEGKSHNAYCIGAVRKFSNQEAVEELLLLRGISCSVCTKLFRRELFHDIRFPVGKTCEDLPVTYKLIKKSTNVLHIGSAKYYNCYRENSRSSHAADARWMDYVVFARDILLDVIEEYPQLARQAEARYILNTLITLKGISGKEEIYAKAKFRLELMLQRMVLRGLLNPFIQESHKKVLLKYKILKNIDWASI
ncbi:MAG: glycosyltransferase [Lachnospiraceae bacterium]|nr:glycosyltransferase [Lachnospiraceae bacterium]